MTIGERLKEIRKTQGYSAKDFAKIVGIPYTTYSNYENDNRDMGIENLKMMSRALGVKIDYFIEDQIEKKAPNIRERVLLDYFNKLTDQGQDKLIDQAELLSRVPEYKK